MLNDWIPIQEKLPVDAKAVLVVRDTTVDVINRVSLGYCMWRPDGQREWKDATCTKTMFPIFWRPLPALPSKMEELRLREDMIKKNVR